jgi:N-glycosylase/DNA lyase
MNNLELPNYNLQHTLLGGQAFNWSLIDSSYYGSTKEYIIKITPKKNHILWQTYPEKDRIDVITNLLNISDDYDCRLEQLRKKDHFTNKAVESYLGLRILKQEFEQTLLSFILSSNNTIINIRRALNKLSENYGTEVMVDNKKFYLFPSIEQLQEINEQEFRDLNSAYSRSFKKRNR